MNDSIPFLATDAKSRLSYLALADDLPADVVEFCFHPQTPLPVLLEQHDQQPAAETTLDWDHVLLGLLYILTWEPQHQQIEYYRRLAVAIQPQLDRYLLQVSREQRDSFHWQTAEQLLLAVLSLHPQQLWPRLELGFLYEQALRISEQREDEEASRHWQSLANVLYHELQHQPMLDPPACYQILFYYLHRHQYYHLRQLLDKHYQLLTSGPVSSLPGLDTNQIDTLLKHLAPFKDNSPVQQALEHYFNADYQQAQRCLFQHQSPSPFVRHLEALQFFKQHNHQQAKALLLQLIPQLHRPSIVATLACCCEGLGQWEEAERYWLEVLGLEPENLQAIHHLALGAEHRGQSEKAQSFWRSLACFDPDFPQLDKHLEQDLRS